MQKILKGNQIQLFYQGKTFAFATAHTLTITGNTADIASKDHGGWSSSSVSNLSWEVTGDYFYTDLDYDALFDLMLYKRPILVQIAEVGNYSENGLVDLGGDVVQWVPTAICKQGYASITSLALNANTGEKATYSLTLTGSGPLVKADNTITPYYIDVKYEDDVLQTGFQLFNVSHHPYVNSVWVYPTGDEGSKDEIRVTNGKLVSEDDIKDITDPVIRFYLPGSNVTEYLFYGISGIYGAYLPDSITTIEEYAFADSSIVSVTTENESINYKPYCFSNCNFLEAVNKTAGASGSNYLCARQIGANAFNSCVRLTDINLGNGCKSVGSFAFSECIIDTVYLGDTIYSIGEGAFSATSMPITLKAYFNTESAPTLQGSNAMGIPAMLEVHLLNSTSADAWTRNFTINGWDAYDPAEGTAYIIGS